MRNLNDNQRRHMVTMVKACGQEIIDRAEEIVGSDGLVSRLGINFPSLYFGNIDGIPELEVHRKHLCRNAMVDEVGPALKKIKEHASKFVNKDSNYHIGDRLYIGKYPTTCVKTEVNEEFNYTDYTFCFDTYLDEAMTYNEMFVKLDDWFWSYTGFDSIRKDIRWHHVPDDRISHLRVPYVGEILGTEMERDHYIPDDPADGSWKEQWESMKDTKNRAAARNGINDYGWLMNEMKDNRDGSPLKGVAASLDCSGWPCAVYCSYAHGVRPVFVIRKDHVLESE